MTENTDRLFIRQNPLSMYGCAPSQPMTEDETYVAPFSGWDLAETLLSHARKNRLRKLALGRDPRNTIASLFGSQITPLGSAG